MYDTLAFNRISKIDFYSKIIILFFTRTIIIEIIQVRKQFMQQFLEKRVFALNIVFKDTQI